MNTGFLLIDKPAGMTSHDVVDRVRRATGERRVGHSGTLDPFATGLLIVGVGRESTKRLGELLKKDKEYVATVVLGATSDTYDRDGRVVAVAGATEPSQGEVEAAAKSFVGKISQVPPLYSAKKVAGKKLYELARKGIEIEVKPSQVEVYEIEVVRYGYPTLEIRVKCSSGTYIRSLGSDIGAKLGCGAYLGELRRTAIDRYRVEDAVPLDKLSPETWKGSLFSLDTIEA